MIVVVGAGAAGLACTIFLARRLGGARVVALDGAPRLGAKILVSGGTRCNLTNAVVTEADFCGGSRPFVRRVLAAFGVEATVALFRELGVEVREEEHGKLFPVTGRARTVLEALVGECSRLGIRVELNRRVASLEAAIGKRFRVACTDGSVRDDERVVLATGGLSLPKTGSDGSGIGMARRLGHRVVETTPALVPLVLGRGFHAGLSGTSADVELTLCRAGQAPIRFHGPLLFTHFGVSGPVVLDVSRHWLRAQLGGTVPRLFVSLLPGQDFEAAERWLLDGARSHPRQRVTKYLAERLPERLALALGDSGGLAPEASLGRLTREERRGLVRALVEGELDVVGSRGYGHAEVTAGGVSLGEIAASTLESRIVPGLHFAGEILDVDGRLGGFNFQWAWSSAWVAARGVADGIATAVSW